MSYVIQTATNFNLDYITFVHASLASVLLFCMTRAFNTVLYTSRAYRLIPASSSLAQTCQTHTSEPGLQLEAMF